MKALNLLLRFLLELSALAALGYFGYHVASGLAAIFLCIAAPLLFAVLWGLFVAHKAKFPPPGPYKALLGAVLLEVTPLVLALKGEGAWAVGMALVIVVNSGLISAEVSIGAGFEGPEAVEGIKR
jgi:uncharacterized protein DUF2568